VVHFKVECAHEVLDKVVANATMKIESEISSFCYIVCPALQPRNKASKLGSQAHVLSLHASRFRYAGVCAHDCSRLYTPRIIIPVVEGLSKGNWTSMKNSWKAIAAGLIAASTLVGSASAQSAPAGCVALTIIRPAADTAVLLEKSMARTVFFGEGITAAEIQRCNPSARVSVASGHVATFAAYLPGAGATYYAPKTGKQTLIYHSECANGVRVYRSAIAVLDRSQPVALVPKEVSNVGCNRAS